MLNINRKKVGNPPNYFDKTFAEYQDGFAVNAELNRVDSLMKISFRQELDLSWRASSTDQPTFIQVEDHHDWLWRACLGPAEDNQPHLLVPKGKLGRNLSLGAFQFLGIRRRAHNWKVRSGLWLSAFRAVHVYSRWYWQRRCGNNQWVGQLFQLTELERQSKHRISFAAHWCLPLLPQYEPPIRALVPIFNTRL